MAKLNRSLIADVEIFNGLQDEDLDTVLEPASALRVAKDAAVFEQGGAAERFFLLLDGALRVVQTTREGQQVIARYIAAGSLVGIAPAIGRDTYPASAVAAVDCVLLSWPMSAWPDLTARFPVFAANAYRTVGQRLQETQDRVIELSLAQVEQRVANAVLRLVRQTGRKTEDGIEIDFPVSRQDIADMTGTTLHTVSRLLSAWESQGMVRSGRKRISVTDPHRLMLVSQGAKDA
ncbi:Crp/Fnr family transcriptional regulator [Zhengella mangrovi]|uniref:Crp/Fnr family transcriptional regulator n=1 Tax=Zhengella mangrovi TaxID=1982044 RepID=A0A2G1QQT1_9HYPH|nr:Crp/Fnr family transcriptional regulator [Zhengella mangrovi]PHP67820.1 Crp/Fnr family transcriptional regulator [Zhengella mangrovi]